MSILHILAIAAMFLAACASVACAADDELKTLRPSHPRLFMLPDDWARLKETVAKDALAGKWAEKLKADATKMLDEKPIEHVLKGPRLLDQSRRAFGRISTLAAIYRLTGDNRFADRARVEMLAAATFADWNPSHFLDTAEMSAALGIGYDWLFDALPAGDRKTIREGLVKLGLKPGLEAFEGEKPAWWTKATHNWGQVCMGGLSVGALVIADEEPKLAGDLLRHTRTAIVPSMKAFGPDGGCPEGPGYWGYATQYHVLYLAAIETALGTDYDYKKIPGVAETGFFRIHSIGPINKTFNFADAQEGAGRTPQMFWLAKAYNQPAFAEHELTMVGDGPNIFHLLWLADAQSQIANRKSQIPPDSLFRGVQCAFFRSAWNDPKALYIGFKGGDNKANHSHLDLGTFVLDAAGQRWALDLGPDDYNLPGYFGKERFTYYRLRTEAHNTLTIDGENQTLDGKAPIIAYQSQPELAYAVADLSDGYRKQVKTVQRGIALVARRSQVVIEDEIEADRPVDVVWNFHTEATIKTDGASAGLSQNGAKLILTILSPADAKFEVIAANPPAPQAQQPKVHNLVIRLPKTQSARITVLMSPGDAPGKAPAVEPLAEWIKNGKL